MKKELDKTLFVIVAATLCVFSCNDGDSGDGTPSDAEEPIGWVVTTTPHSLSDSSLLSLWERQDGAIFAAGWGGTILFRPPPNLETPDVLPVWQRMSVPVTANLTAITGVGNGQQFGLPAAEGEMFAVGWGGTLLHYHPNPDLDPATADGEWRAINDPSAPTLVPRLKIDPECPDYDGDGIADDGDGDGWWGNAVCSDRQTIGCDDNCRTAVNGPLRPLVDLDRNACIGPGDAADASASQLDTDADAVGDVCDGGSGEVKQGFAFTSDLFSVLATQQDGDLTVVAVGEGGAVVSYTGRSAAEPVPGGASSVEDSLNWIAQRAATFRFDVDPDAGAPVGTPCSGRLCPVCPAQCNPAKVDCACSGAQCCDPTTSTGNPAAAQGCNAANGACDNRCPGCFRRLTFTQTLRSVAVSEDALVVVGAEGTILTGTIRDPSGVWTAFECETPPFDRRPLLTAVHASGGPFYATGSGGALSRNPNRRDCESIDTDTFGFLSAVHSPGNNRAYVAGDGGLLMEIRGDQVLAISTGIEENLFAVVSSNDLQGRRVVYFAGASAVIGTATYYPPPEQ